MLNAGEKAGRAEEARSHGRVRKVAAIVTVEESGRWRGLAEVENRTRLAMWLRDRGLVESAPTCLGCSPLTKVLCS